MTIYCINNIVAIYAFFSSHSTSQSNNNFTFIHYFAVLVCKQTWKAIRDGFLRKARKNTLTNTDNELVFLFEMNGARLVHTFSERQFGVLICMCIFHCIFFRKKSSVKTFVQRDISEETENSNDNKDASTSYCEAAKESIIDANNCSNVSPVENVSDLHDEDDNSM